MLRVGARVPDASEAEAVGAPAGRIHRASPAFTLLVRCNDPGLSFKDEEGTGADRVMTVRLQAGLRRLNQRVRAQWPGVRLRITESWDEDREHGPTSLHYEGRAADITTSDVDSRKLGRLAWLATGAGFDWVFYEDGSHVHVSVRP